MKKTLHLILAFIAMFLSANAAMAQSGSVDIDGITYYSADGQTAYVSGFVDTTLTHAKILASVTINGYALPVTGIGSYAFGTNYSSGKTAKYLSSVEFPSSITNIDDHAFHGCSQLESVDLPNALTGIGKYAFMGTNITSMELPASVSEIGYCAFSDKTTKLTCKSTTPPTLIADKYDGGSQPTLQNISIVFVPDGCAKAYKSVDPWASAVVVDGNGVSVSVNVTPGMLGEEILNHTNALPDVNYLTISGALNETDINHIKNSMPNLLTIDMAGVDMKIMPNDMFYERKALLGIILPKNVEKIGSKSFTRCINLENIVLPEGLKRIDDSYESYSNYGAFYGCTSLKSVTSPSTLEYIGDYAFSQCTSLKKIEMKSGLSSIGQHAFAYCNRLKEVILPNTLTNCDGGAFRGCTALEEITLPKGLKQLGYEYESSNDNMWDYERGVFSGCASLKKIILPEGLETISQFTFEQCANLTEIVIPEGVSFIGKNAFRGCQKLNSVSLPSTLTRCSTTPFSGCNQLTEIKCLALLPPSLADGLLTLDDMGLAVQRTLNVPEWTLNRYKLASGWAAFSDTRPIPGIYPSSINVVNETTLTLPSSGLPTNYKPDMTISYYWGNGMGGYSEGALHLKGSGTLQLSKFKTHFGFGGAAGGTAKLLNEATMTADSVSLSMYLERDYYDNNGYQSKAKWHFLSFPFDVKISDVVTNCDWVVRKYDGAERAKGNYNNTWTTVPYGEMLHAGQGYIWSCSGGNFELSAIDNANKNQIFANSARTIPLQEYASEHVSNSSWNLVGNPYPCYYDVSKMDYTAPITVWDRQNNTYAAYSPVDDNYVLWPYEAFFVQKPANVSSITFEADGRQLTYTSSASANPPTARSQSDGSEVLRHVINLELSNGQFADRTRIVINNEAKMEYELECDASKFANNDMSQLYSVSDGDKYAINERPIDNGVVKLGTNLVAGGTYTIALKDESDLIVVLLDKNTGIETDLALDSYTFTADADDDERFEVRLFADDRVTAIDGVFAKEKISVVGNAVVVSAGSDVNVELFNMAGSMVAKACGRNVTLNAAPGLYVVKLGETTHKVIIGK